MSIFDRFRPPPPPPPIYKRQPIATIAVILTLISMFVLGPVGYIVKSIGEEMEKKANNETVILYMKQQKETDDRQWKAIEQQIQAPKNLSINTPNKKVALTPSEFEKYMSLAPEIRVKYKKYLESTGKDVSGLPE